MIHAGLELSRQRAQHLLGLLRGTLLAGGAHRRIADALTSFRQQQPNSGQGFPAGIAALGNIGGMDHGDALGRDVEAALGGLLSDVLG